MFKKNRFKNKITKILEDKFTNWEDKGYLISNLIQNEDEFGEEIFLDILENHYDPKIRRHAASVVGYTNFEQFIPKLIDRILLENDWRVRFSLSRSSARLAGEKVADLLLEKYNSLIQENNHPQFIFKIKKALCESLGSMGIEKGIPILLTILENELKNPQTTSIDLLVQIIYSLGESGNEETIKALMNYLNNREFQNKSMRDSTNHALEKIAKKMGYNSLKDYLNKAKDN